MLSHRIQEKINQAKHHDLLRERFPINDRHYPHVSLQDKSCLHFCSNDYLGLSEHPEVKKAFIQGVEQFGLGSGASALVSGYFKIHQQLEDSFAEFMHVDRCLLFSSGYLANVG